MYLSLVISIKQLARILFIYSIDTVLPSPPNPSSQSILIPRCTKNLIQIHVAVLQASVISTTEESFESQSQMDHSWFLFPISAELLSTTSSCEHIFSFVHSFVTSAAFSVQNTMGLEKSRRIQQPGVIYLYLAASV